MREKLRIGELNNKTAEICKDLGCHLYSDNPYKLCQVTSKLNQQRGNPVLARSQIGRDFHDQIPEECPKGYYDYRPKANSSIW